MLCAVRRLYKASSKKPSIGDGKNNAHLWKMNSNNNNERTKMLLTYTSFAVRWIYARRHKTSNTSTRFFHTDFDLVLFLFFFYVVSSLPNWNFNISSNHFQRGMIHAASSWRLTENHVIENEWRNVEKMFFGTNRRASDLNLPPSPFELCNSSVVTNMRKNVQWWFWLRWKTHARFQKIVNWNLRFSAMLVISI